MSPMSRLVDTAGYTSHRAKSAISHDDATTATQRNESRLTKWGSRPACWAADQRPMMIEVGKKL